MLEIKEKLTVQKTSTRQIRVHHTVLRTPSLLNIIRKARISRSAKHLADGTLLNELADLDTEREVTSPDSLHEEKILLSRSFAEDLSLSRVDGKRLLTQDVLAGSEG